MNEATYRVQVTVNGTPYESWVTPRKTLADYLRDELGLKGTHIGCEHGVCGACTVLFDGATARSCILYAVQADGRSVVTIEGLTPEDGQLGPVQAALHEHHGLQCGFCTPGVVVAIWEILQDSTPLNAADLREALSGNICRCTGYQGILEALGELTGLDVFEGLHSSDVSPIDEPGGYPRLPQA